MAAAVAAAAALAPAATTLSAEQPVKTIMSVPYQSSASELCMKAARAVSFLAGRPLPAGRVLARHSAWAAEIAALRVDVAPAGVI